MPTATPTPPPIFDDFHPSDVITINTLEETSRWWNDGEPFLLLGCHTGIIGSENTPPGKGIHLFRQLGIFHSEVSFKEVVIFGEFEFETARQAYKQCFAMIVEFDGYKDYTRGYSQATTQYAFFVQSGNNWLTPLDWDWMYNYVK